MHTVQTLPFREVWAVDFEFKADPGERPVVHCLCALELKTGRLLRLWKDDLKALKEPPYDIGPDSLLVAYTAAAELSCHLVLGWEMPAYVLDLYPEFLNWFNGYKPAHGKGLLGAMLVYGLEGIEANEKEGMRGIAIRGGPFTEQEKWDLLDYNETDVRALHKLLPRMLPDIELPYALLRGRYMRAVTVMEHNGIPLDAGLYRRVSRHWKSIRDQLVAEIDKDFGVFDGMSFRSDRFLQLCARQDIGWPLLDSGRPELKREVFRDMAKIHPQLAPLHELRTTLSDLRNLKLEIGSDGRNRTWLNPFGSRTSRNQPSSVKNVFGPATWLRSFIQPPEGYGLAYIDWGQQEFAIAAVLSSDERMLQAYLSGDPYLAFAKMAKAVPDNATKQSHKAIRERFKQCMLAVNYGMGARSLAEKINGTSIAASGLLRLHQQTFSQFWQWSTNMLDHMLVHGMIQTPFGWCGRPGSDPNERSIRNFPVQAAGADIMRIAACGIVESGIRLAAPVHDAFLIESPLERLDDDIAKVRALMADAGAAVLSGLQLKTDVEVFRYPARYSDPRGVRMWETVMQLIRKLEPPTDTHWIVDNWRSTSGNQRRSAESG